MYENQFNIYKVLTTPEKKLYLSYPIADEEGKALRNSILIAQIKKIFPKIKEQSDVIEKDYEITTKEATLDSAVEKYKEYIDTDKIDDEWKNVISWYEKNEPTRMQRILRGAKYSNVPEVVTEENIKKMYGGSLRTSVSRLEQYRRCPFSFHLKYGLKLQEEEEFKIRPLDTGNFMHEVIDEVFSKI